MNFGLPSRKDNERAFDMLSKAIKGKPVMSQFWMKRKMELGFKVNTSKDVIVLDRLEDSILDLAKLFHKKSLQSHPEKHLYQVTEEAAQTFKKIGDISRGIF